MAVIDDEAFWVGADQVLDDDAERAALRRGAISCDALLREERAQKGKPKGREQRRGLRAGLQASICLDSMGTFRVFTRHLPNALNGHVPLSSHTLTCMQQGTAQIPVMCWSIQWPLRMCLVLVLILLNTERGFASMPAPLLPTAPVLSYVQPPAPAVLREQPPPTFP
eukprot:6187677-Pleurochrysis_carterae.AAC.2